MVSNGITDVSGVIVFVFDGNNAHGRLFLCTNAPTEGVVGVHELQFKAVAHSVEQLGAGLSAMFQKKKNIQER